MKATITAVSKYLPEKILTNFDLERLVDTSDEWIVSRTGISERRIVGEGEATSHMCTKVAEELLQKTHTNPNDVDVIIVGTITPDMSFPSAAVLVQDNIQAKNAWGFDLSAACSGFLYALESGARMIESGAYKKVLVIGSDTMSSIVNYEDRNTCVLFGDGAGGVMLEPSNGADGLLDSVLAMDGSGAKYLNIPAGGSMFPTSSDTVERKLHYVHQEGRKVYKFAVKGMADTALEILKRNNLSGEDIALFIPHQANRRIIEASAERLGMPLDKVLINIENYANTTGATIPIAMCEAVETNRIQAGEYLLLAAFGGGFTWGSSLIRWGNCK